MKDILKGIIYGFCGSVAAYFVFMFFINTLLWWCTDESEIFYQPVWNIMKLM